MLADTIDIRTSKVSARIKRSILENADSTAYNQTVPGESLRLRRVVHVVGPDDLPEFTQSGTGTAIYGTLNGKEYNRNEIASLIFYNWN